MDFMRKKNCDRCGNALTFRMMSRLNRDCLCLDCIEREKTLPFYSIASEEERKHAVYGDKDYDPDYAGLFEMSPEEMLSISSVTKKKELLKLLLSDIQPKELYDLLDGRLQDGVYQEKQKEHVVNDLLSYDEFSSFYDGLVSIEDAELIAEQFAYHRDYDCNLSYWDNLKNLIHKHRR